MRSTMSNVKPVQIVPSPFKISASICNEAIDLATRHAMGSYEEIT